MSSYTSGEILSNSGVEQFDRSNAAFIVPTTTSSLMEPYTTGHFGNESAPFVHGIQKNISTSHTNTSSSSYTFVQIKREPCQVSEVTTSNNCHQQTSSKTMSSTLTTLVKIESSSPKVTELEKSVQVTNSSNTVPIGIAVARKRPQESIHSSAQVQQSFNKDNMNCFGIRVADIGGVAATCGNIYFTGAGDLMTGSTAEELAISATGVQNLNRTPSAFWPYPNAVPLESVISMSPATVGLQYSRDTSRGQVVLLPAPATALDPFSQTAAFVWPSYIPQGSAPLQPPPNFIFPSMSPHSTIQPQSYTPLQLFGSNYFTAAAAAAAAAAASSTLCQHNQTGGNNNNTNNNRFLGLPTDMKRMDPIVKHPPMKLEEWNSENMIIKPPTYPHQNHSGGTFDREKPKYENVSSLMEIQPHHLARITSCSTDSHPIQTQPEYMFQATPSPSPLLNMPLLPRNMNFITNPPIDDVINYNKSIEPSTLVHRTTQMQDVNIQTDTPVCSEDENSSCPLAMQTIPNSNNNVSNFEHCRTPLLVPQSIASPMPLPSSPEQCHRETNCCSEIEENEKQDEPNETSQIDNTETNCIPQASSSDPVESNLKNIQATSPLTVMTSQGLQEPVDLTGLELLSNISTSSFANNTLNVKREPLEQYDSTILRKTDLLSAPDSLDKQSIQNNEENHQDIILHQADRHSPPVEEPLGGLNLLCALAEQRIQEEVQSSSNIFGEQQCSPPQYESLLPEESGMTLQIKRPNIATKLTEMIKSVKRKKHKHSKSKSNKKSKYSKKNKKKCGKGKGSNKSDFDANSEDIQEDLKSAFKKVDVSYSRFGKWPNPEEIFKAMETDMRMRLADITRQYRKKKRKLEEISKSKKKKKTSALEASFILNTPNPEAAGSAAPLNISTPVSLCENKFSPFSCKTPNGHVKSNFTFAEKCPNQNSYQTNFPPDPCSTQLSDASQSSPPSLTYKHTILDQISVSNSNATENVKLNIKNDCKYQSSCQPDLLLPQSQSSKSNLSPNNVICLRAQKHSTPEKSSHYTTYKERKLIDLDKSKQTNNAFHLNSATYDEKVQTNCADTSLDGSKREIGIDRELILTNEHLYSKETRVLTDMGGLFYAGVMKPLQPPDIYAITLDGERGNKSHIMSREEIFKDTILEVAPKSIESVPVGTRLCAYWSQQYRCLYPGRAIESEFFVGTPQDFVSVEFDDGDSGRIRLQNIRFLLSDYPIVEYNDNPLYSLGKQKKSVAKASCESIREKTAANVSLLKSLNDNRLDMYVQRSEKKRLRGLKKSTILSSDLIEKNRKHRKHKKRKKHKKHHRKSSNSSPYIKSPSTIVVNKLEENCEHNVTQEMNGITLNSSPLVDDNEETKNHNSRPKTNETVQSLKLETSPTSEKIKTETFDLEEETTSNLMSENSDEIKADEEFDHNNGKGSKIAAFLPERQLWGWLGQSYRKAGQKGRARKQFYKSIKRGKETITVGDCAVFLSTGRPDRPYIGRIESMWETTSSNKVVRVRWFYHPEETTGCPELKYPGALFESPHEDENDVQTISHRCEVLSFAEYFEKFGSDSKKYQSIYDNNDTYYLSGYYNPRIQVLKLQEDIPALAEKTTNV